MSAIMLFTFGYDGWGNATPQLVQAVDAVERSRGFKPPIFVDIRIRRTVRAEGFKGSNFETLLGEKRHRWMRSLGNKAIITRTGPPIQIAVPSSANELLDLAIESSDDNRRVIFFCSCPWPRWCHRKRVATLVLRAAKKRKVPVQIIEWPGGEPVELDITLPPDTVAAVLNGRGTIRLNKTASLAQYAGIPWGSVLNARSNEDHARFVCGPAKYIRHEWQLPVWQWFAGEDWHTSEILKEAKRERKRLGFEPITL